MTVTADAVNPDAFRTAMARYPTGVAVVTVVDPAGAGLAMTVNSFASVSLTPPLVLWSVDCASPRAEAFTRAETFTVSVLRADDRAVAERFAADGGFARDEAVMTPCPLDGVRVTRALAWFACRCEALHPGGDHTIIVGRVEALGVEDTGPALTYFESAYGATSGS